jgi:thiamine kinase-like enzyme
VSEDNDARRRLFRLPGFTPETARAARLTPLAGLTNRVFLVETGDRSFCLRIPAPGTEAIIDRRAEQVNARLAAAAGVAPEVVYFGEDGVMLTGFVPGDVLTPVRLRRSPGALQRAAAALRALHERTADFAGTYRVFDTMQSYLALLDERGAELSAGDRRLLAEATALRDALAAHPVRLRPCHCDPTGRNLIDTGERVWLIDWEYAAMNDPMWDLAYFSVESDLEEAADRDLLTAYLQRPPSVVEIARLEAVKAVCDLLAGLWALVQQAQGNRVADSTAYAKRLFQRAAARMAEPDFAGKLETLSRG